MKSKRVILGGIFATSLSIVLAMASSAVASGSSGPPPIDCTEETKNVGPGELTDNYISHGGSVACLRFVGGGSLNGNGHTITCVGECKAPAILVDTSSGSATGNQTVLKVTIEGHWQHGIKTSTLLPVKQVTIKQNTFTGIGHVAIQGGTSILQNMIEGERGDFRNDSEDGDNRLGAAIALFTGVGYTQTVQDNWIDLEQGRGIVFVGTDTSATNPIKVKQNLVRLDPANDAPASFVYSSSSDPITLEKNIFQLVNPAAGGPFFQFTGMAPEEVCDPDPGLSARNLCDHKLREFTLPEPANFPAPFGFNPEW